MNNKQCNDCKQIKSVDLFDKRIDRGNRPMSYCKECRKLRQNKHNSLLATKEHNAERGRVFYSENREDLLEKSKEWRDAIKELYGVSYNTLKKRTDIQYKLRQNIRKRLFGVLTLKKTLRTVDLLGCSLEELKKHLESKFYPNPETGEVMGWDNYGVGGWEIDHIKPLSLFDLSKLDELKDASNFSNLQPLWAKDNRRKSDKYVI